jgi:hypothetical protein
MRSLSDPRVPPALVSTLTAALPQFHHDFNTFDHLYTHNLLPLQAYLNHITNTVDTLLSTTAKSILGLRLSHPHKHHDPHNLHPPPTHTPEHTRARKTLHEDHQHAIRAWSKLSHLNPLDPLRLCAHDRITTTRSLLHRLDSHYDPTPPPYLFPSNTFSTSHS